VIGDLEGRRHEPPRVVDIPSRDLPWPGVDLMRVTFWVRNPTRFYAAWSDPGYPEQVLLGAPRTYELSASAKW
jgi:iron complex outermembrane receptor protein